MTTDEAIDFLMRVHYKFFMANTWFWYEPDLIAADFFICKAASDLRCGK